MIAAKRDRLPRVRERMRTLARVAASVARCGTNKDRAYLLLAQAAYLSVRAGDRRRCPDWVARAMIGAASSRARLEAARELREALVEGDVERVRSIANTVRRSPDLGAEKILSHRYRFLWICNPKVASRSLIAALRAMDPDAQLIESKTIAAVNRAEPRSRGYLSFAFVRDPYDRAHSFYADKVVHADQHQHPRIGPYHGISQDSDFDAVCSWLNTPYGADAFAERHWLSQHRQIQLPSGRLPDFVGRYERLEADLSAIAQRLGMPDPALPWINRMGDRRLEGPLTDGHRLRERALNATNRTLLRRRYAADFDLLGFPR